MQNLYDLIYINLKTYERLNKNTRVLLVYIFLLKFLRSESYAFRSVMLS